MDAKTRFEENTSLVFLVLHRNFTNLAWDADLQQIGMLGLWKACLTFDDSKGYQFSTYASRCICNEVLMHFRKEKKINKLPTITIEDHLSEEIAEDHFYSFAAKDDAYEYSGLLEVFNQVLSRYSDRDRKIIELYMCNVSQTDMTKYINLSQPMISRIIKKFKKEM